MYLPVRNYTKAIDLIKGLEKETVNFTVALIDIDYFHRKTKSKQKNIERVYFFLKESLSEKVIYLGKDEFLFIESELLENIFVRLIEVKADLFKSTGISFSAGIAEFPKHGEDHIEILRNIEEALYFSKLNGRDKISMVDIQKMKLKSNYYTPTQLNRLNNLSDKLNRSEASLLREALDELIRKYEHWVSG